MKALSTAIFGKMTSSTDLYADVTGRLYKGQAPANAVYPYVVYILVSDMAEYTFTSSLEDTTIQFSLFSSASGSTQVEDMFTHLKTLYDDCTLTITGSTLIWMVRQNAVLMVEDHTTPAGTQAVWHYAVDYSIMLQHT